MRSQSSNPMALASDTDGDCIAYRLPTNPSEVLPWGAELHVNKRQEAHLGPANGAARTELPTICFKPGRYSLTTKSIEQLVSYVTENVERQGALRASVTFVTTDPIADLQWKDRDPLYVSDTVLGKVPVQVEATFGVLIKDTFLFSHRVMGDQREYSCKDLESYCRSYLLRPAFIKAVSNLSRPIHLLESFIDQLTSSVVSCLAVTTQDLGLDLVDLDIHKLKVSSAIEKASRNVGQDLRGAKRASKHGLYGVSASLGLDLVVPRGVNAMLPANPGALPDGATVRATNSSTFEQLEHLATLRDRGVLTHTEFDQYKFHLIGLR